MGVLTIELVDDKVNQKICIVGYCKRMKARRSRYFCYVHVKHEEVQKVFDKEKELLDKIDDIANDTMKKAEVLSKKKEKTKALVEESEAFVSSVEKREQVLNTIIEEKLASLQGKRKRASDPKPVEVRLPTEVVPMPASKVRRTVTAIASVVAFTVGYLW